MKVQRNVRAGYLGLAVLTTSLLAEVCRLNYHRKLLETLKLLKPK